MIFKCSNTDCPADAPTKAKNECVKYCSAVDASGYLRKEINYVIRKTDTQCIESDPSETIYVRKFKGNDNVVQYFKIETTDCQLPFALEDILSNVKECRLCSSGEYVDALS